MNSMHLLMGKIGRPECAPMQFAGQPSSMNTREIGADGAYPAYLNWEDQQHMRELAKRWKTGCKIRIRSGISARPAFGRPCGSSACRPPTSTASGGRRIWGAGRLASKHGLEAIDARVAGFMSRCTVDRYGSAREGASVERFVLASDAGVSLTVITYDDIANSNNDRVRPISEETFRIVSKRRDSAWRRFIGSSESNSSEGRSVIWRTQTRRRSRWRDRYWWAVRKISIRVRGVSRVIASRWVSGDMAIIDPPGDETLDGSLRTRHSCSQYPGGTRMDLAEPTGMKLCSDGLAFRGSRMFDAFVCLILKWTFR